MPIGQGRNTIQRKAPRKNGWTVKRRQRFLEVLGETCNIRAAARAVDSDPAYLFRLRKSDVEFGRLWAEALEDGAERLREELLAQQLRLIPSEHNPVIDPPEATPAQLDPAKVLAALKAFEGFGDGRRRTVKPATQAEVDRVLMARLEQLAVIMARREQRRAVCPPGVDRPELVTDEGTAPKGLPLARLEHRPALPMDGGAAAGDATDGAAAGRQP